MHKVVSIKQYSILNIYENLGGGELSPGKIEFGVVVVHFLLLLGPRFWGLTILSAVLTHASSHTNVGPRAFTRTCVAGLLYSPVRPLVDVNVFRVLQRAINTSKAGPSVSLTPTNPSETLRVFTDDLEWSLIFLFSVRARRVGDD